MVKYFYIFLILVFSFSTSKAQKDIDFTNPKSIKTFKVPDSLNKIPFTGLYKKYINNLHNTSKALFYMHCYLKKGFIVSDSIKIARAYHRLSQISIDSLSLPYLNQSILYSKNSKHALYPSLAYLLKGNIYFKNANYKKALDNYFKANDIAKKVNPQLACKVKFNIGLLKTRIGENEEALKIFEEYRRHIEDEKYTNTRSYLLSLNAIAHSQSRINQLDNATATNNFGIKHALAQKDTTLYNYFVMNEGVNLFLKEQYAQSIDSLLKTVPFLLKENDLSYLIFTRFYLGKSFLNSNMTEKALAQFKAVDTLLKERLDFAPETRETYKILIDYYKKNDDKEKQLFYLNRLTVCDSILRSNYKYINKKIISDFDTPEILLEKEKIIAELNTSNTTKTKWVIMAVSFSLFICLLLLYRNRKTRKEYEQKFEKLINHPPQKPTPSIEQPKKYEETKSALSKEVITKIEKGLNSFVLKNEYLDKNVSIGSLAKKMDSNSKYVSQYINYYEKKKFTDYINELRIEHAIERIKSDSKFRKYTIKAISEAVGFSNPVSFSRAFLKKTGIKPSYFVKKVESLEVT